MIKFTAHCQRDHDRVDFTDPTEFERHMTTAHKARKIATRRTGPYHWTAPKAPASTEALARALSAYADVVADVDVDGAIPDGIWRWDRDGADSVPAHALPTNVRTILEGARARGEAWLVQVKGPKVRLEVGRGRAFGGAGPTVGVKVEAMAGKVRKVYTVDPTRPNAPTGWWEGKITRARELFPPAGRGAPALVDAA